MIKMRQIVLVTGFLLAQCAWANDIVTVVLSNSEQKRDIQITYRVCISYFGSHDKLSDCEPAVKLIIPAKLAQQVPVLKTKYGDRYNRVFNVMSANTLDNRVKSTYPSCSLFMGSDEPATRKLRFYVMNNKIPCIAE